jgi:xanthosine utilization system XapX-like protein
VLRSIGYGVAGALVGCLLTFMLVNRPAEPLLFIMAILGSILTLAARRYARF